MKFCSWRFSGWMDVISSLWFYTTFSAWTTCFLQLYFCLPLCVVQIYIMDILAHPWSNQNPNFHWIYRGMGWKKLDYVMFNVVFKNCFICAVKCTWLEKRELVKLLLWRKYEWTTRERGYIPTIAWFLSMPRFTVIHGFTSFVQFPITAIREIKILKKLHHENVIKLKEIVTSPGRFEDMFCSMDFLIF